MARILLISRDPGATNQLVALRHILSGPDSERRRMLFHHLHLTACPEIIPIAKDYAKNIWLQNGITVEDWPEITSQQQISAYLHSFNPQQIITGTCHIDDRTEQMIWRLARRRGITTTAFLDSGDNIELRFRDGTVILPDRVALIDSITVSAMRALGLPNKAIFIPGDLYQHYITQQVVRDCEHDSLRSRWETKKEESLILFASDYIREMQALGLSFEITEFDGLDCLINLLISGDISDYVKDLPAPYRLIIRPHPKDSTGKYLGYESKGKGIITIVINDSGPSRTAILSAHLVASVGSSLINEAETLGVRALKLGPVVTARKDQQKTV